MYRSIQRLSTLTDNDHMSVFRSSFYCPSSDRFCSNEESATPGSNEFTEDENVKIEAWLEDNWGIGQNCLLNTSKSYHKFLEEYSPPSIAERNKYLPFVKVDPFSPSAKLKRLAGLPRRNKKPSSSIDARDRRSVEIQTTTTEPSDYTENKASQTDFYDMKPVRHPKLIREAIGIDAATSIPSGDLLNFEMEAQPIIDVIVESSLKESMLEVDHIGTLAETRKLQKECEEKRRRDCNRLRRLEANERWLLAEKERRLRQSAIATQVDEGLQTDIMSRKMVADHGVGLVTEIVNDAYAMASGVEKDLLMGELCPWLDQSVDTKLSKTVKANKSLNEFIKEIIKERQETYVTPCDDEQKPVVTSEKAAVDGEECGECEEEDGEDERCSCQIK